MGCKDKNSSWHLIGFHDGSRIGSTAQSNVGEKPTVIHRTLITSIAMQDESKESLYGRETDRDLRSARHVDA